MLRFVVALAAEARPLIERYGLERVRSRPFKIYRGGEVILVVSGIGKVAAAAATSYLHLAAGGGEKSGWINVGIAGHRGRRLGEAAVAHRIRDLASGRSWDLPRLSTSPCPSDEVLTVDRPEKELREPGLYDMEASGFYPTARRFASRERVHCLKVVSDGPGTDPKTLTARRIGELIEARLDAVERLAEVCLPRL